MNLRNVLFFLFAALLTGTLTWSLNRGWVVEGQPIPAFGKLLNPFTGFWQNGEAPIVAPPMPVTANLLGDSVSVHYDDRMVPHIFADTMPDLMFVQGYLHAANRLFQMDFGSRAAAGRLSEVVGEKALDFDRKQREWGFPMAAANAVKAWQSNKEGWALLEAYAAGVNTYIATLTEQNMPVEFKVLGFEPEPWTPYKTALMTKNMAKTLCFGEFDAQASKTQEAFGAGDFNFLFPETFKEQTPIMPNGTPFNFTPVQVTEGTPPMAAPYLGTVEPQESEGILGSNSWAVGKSRTASGNTMLCGDPHLGLTLPSIWYELQMSDKYSNSYGVSIPGIPGILIGFNDHIAWTETNGGHDVADWYQITWKDASRTHYMVDGQAVAAKIVVDTIRVNSLKEPVLDTIRYTQFGPVFNLKGDAHEGMALRWVAHEASPTEMMTFVKLMHARNYNDYVNALSGYVSPIQNFTFAAKDGDIAIHANGNYPLHGKQEGRFVQDGSKAKNNWKGFIPREQIPKAKNPAQGYLTSANQQAVGSGYPYYINSEKYEGFRGRIANNYLRNMKNATLDSMKMMQNSTFGLHAYEALPHMLKYLDTTKISEIALPLVKALQSWDYQYKADQKTPVIFDLWWNEFYTNLWDEVLKHPDSALMLQPTMWRTIFLLRDDPKNRFFDKKATANQVETAKEILTASLNKAAEAYAQKLVLSPTLNWGSHLDVSIGHIARMNGFDKTGIGVGGHHRALNAQQKNFGPSWRMIVELADTTRAWVVYPGGQSGNPGSSNYDDFVDKWAKGEYYEALFLPARSAKSDRIKFTQTFSKAKK